MNPIIFNALAEPNRLDIVELLKNGPCSVNEIVDRLQLHQPQVSKHLRFLNDAGLVEVRPFAQQRFYQLRPQPLKELNQWLASYRSLWEERVDRLEAVVLEKKKNEGR